jgi:hypothetical protein
LDEDILQPSTSVNKVELVKLNNDKNHYKPERILTYYSTLNLEFLCSVLSAALTLSVVDDF